jgi:hypothetical protein
MRMFDVREPSVAALEVAPVYFRYGANRRRILVDRTTASAVLACYHALETREAKAKFERMIAGSPLQFMKLVDFCWGKVRLGAT